MSSLRLALLAPLALTACFPTLEGDWEGEMECSGVLFVMEMELEEVDYSVYEGGLEMFVDDVYQSDGVEYRLAVDYDLDILFERDGFGEQELDYAAYMDDMDCRLYEEGDLVSADCYELDLAIDEGERLNVADFIWDGADTIELEDREFDCEGELER